MAKDAAYHRAEQKIEEARRSGATKLDLSQSYGAEDSDKLTELPDSLWELTQLQSLDLSRNRLTALPDAIGQLTQLQSLNLSNNQLTAEAIGTLFSALTALQSLNLSSNQLTVLPESIGQITALQSLDLSHNQLTALPESIGRLTALQSLNLYNNQLTALPEAIGQLTALQSLNLSNNRLTTLPEIIGQLTALQLLNLQRNRLMTLPETTGQLTALQKLDLCNNELDVLPECISNLTQLTDFRFAGNRLSTIPEWICKLILLEHIEINGNEISKLPDSFGKLKRLKEIWMGGPFGGAKFTDLPPSLAQLEHLERLKLDDNPLNPELAAAYEQGLDTVMAYLRAKAEAQIVLNEAKLILVGEGGVGKTSLLAALRGEEFVENRPTTHGVEVDIKSLVVKDPDNGTDITLNGWDFGGQNIYRHTHQLFFTAPAVYLAVWEPRRGPEQCRVAEWIKMVKHRAYDEARPEERPRILVVATHGGPTERLDHIDEQALRDEFSDLICGFHHVDSKPDDDDVCYHLDELKAAIGREATAIPSVGRTVPLSWKNVLESLRRRSEHDPYIPYDRFEALCNRQKVSNELAATYATILNELGHLIYYRGDETLKDTVILKPDYLSKAVSFVLEDKPTKDAHGLVEHERLGLLWHNPDRPANERYPRELHPVFRRLMTKFDLSYQVVMPEAGAPPTSLMAQLVPGQRPEGWQDDWALKPGDVERTQVCRVLDATTGRTVEAEGLMYRLIVRLHRYSLGRNNYYDSCHWKTGMILDDGYNGRAFIDEVGGDIYVTVRAAYPEGFLAVLSSEIRWLVEHFWKGLDARLFVPCPTEGCKGLLELGEIVDFKCAGMPKVRCTVCKQFHEIDPLMATTQPKPEWQDAIAQLRSDHRHIMKAQDIGFDRLSTQLRVLMSQADEQYTNLLSWLSDPAKEGPRLFSFIPTDRSKFDPRTWVKAHFYVILWCEHSRKPVYVLNEPSSRAGIIEVEFTRKWFKTAAPVLKVLTGTLSLILPIASAGVKLAMDQTVYETIADQLDFGQEIIEASLSGSEKVMGWLDDDDKGKFERSVEPIHAQGDVLRELHAILKKKDPSFGGLVRVQNKRREFLWVHERFRNEYP